jgi:hypothetical protein
LEDRQRRCKISVICIKELVMWEEELSAREYKYATTGRKKEKDQ